MSHSLEPVAICQSPYRQKFAIPRQPNLVPAAIGRLLLAGECNQAELLRGVDQFSHLWLIFSFHQNLEQGWKPTVRPPRLGGNKRIGVFASRATFRPNGLGISPVKLHRVGKQGKQHFIDVAGIDLLDGTPIYDIKPYVPYSDAIEDAVGGYANNPPLKFTTRVTPEAEAALAEAEAKQPGFIELARQVLAQDPRPAYKQEDPDREYGVQLYQFDLRWRVIEGENWITNVVLLP